MVQTEISLAAPLTTTPSSTNEVFGAICERYLSPIYNYTLRLMRDPDDAEELTQDVFLKAFIAYPRMPNDLQLTPWLYRIATNCCLDVLRRRQVILYTPLPKDFALTAPAQDPEEQPETAVLLHEEKTMVAQLLDRLPQRYRVALLLKEFQELSCEEIGQVLGCKRGAVKSLLYRARERAREVMEELDHPIQSSRD